MDTFGAIFFYFLSFQTEMQARANNDYPTILFLVGVNHR